MDQKIKSHWVNARTVTVCDRAACRRAFTINERRHHCRVCGRVYCDACSPKDLCLTYLLTDPDALGEDEEATAPDADELAESGGLPLQVCLRRLSRDHSELPGGVPFTRPRVTARVRRWRGSAGASSASGTSSAPPPPPPSYYSDTPRPSPRTNRTRRAQRGCVECKRDLERAYSAAKTRRQVTSPFLFCGFLAVVSRPLLAHCFSLCDLRLFVTKRILLSELPPYTHRTPSCSASLASPCLLRLLSENVCCPSCILTAGGRRWTAQAHTSCATSTSRFPPPPPLPPVLTGHASSLLLY